MSFGWRSCRGPRNLRRRRPLAARQLRQTQRRFQHHRRQHQHQKRPPDLLDQRARIARPIIHAGEIQAAKQLSLPSLRAPFAYRLPPAADSPPASARRPHKRRHDSPLRSIILCAADQPLPRLASSPATFPASTDRVLPSAPDPAASARCTNAYSTTPFVASVESRRRRRRRPKINAAAIGRHASQQRLRRRGASPGRCSRRAARNDDESPIRQPATPPRSASAPSKSASLAPGFDRRQLVHPRIPTAGQKLPSQSALAAGKKRPARRYRRRFAANRPTFPVGSGACHSTSEV